jgi:hypothetical protein
MHCRSCDVLLTDAESTRKDAITGEYLDMCNGCLAVDEDDNATFDEDTVSLDEYLEGVENLHDTEHKENDND